MQRQVCRPDYHNHEFVPLRQPAQGDLNDDTEIELSSLCSRCTEIREWLRTSFSELKYRADLPAKKDHRELHLSLRNDKSSGELWKEFDHPVGGYSLESSYEAGCHLCTLIWVAITDHGGSRMMLPSSLEKARGIGPLRIAVGSLEPFHSSEPPALVDQHGIFAKLSLKNKVGGLISSENIFIRSQKLGQGSSASPNTSPLSTRSSVSRDLVAQWFSTCSQKHSRCSLRTASTLPTRLLGICPYSKNDVVQIVETSDLKDLTDTRYAALSYCWGGQTALMLTKTNYENLRVGVPIRKLPRTIQDAIEITKSIRLPWLWVDSLCIVQDSPEDWATEAAKMYDVYRGCFVSIAARGAVNSREGIFTRRDPLRHARCHLFTANGDESIDILSPYLTGENYIRPWALDTRGWVIQEQLLPPRTIKFGTYLSWECRELHVDEFGLEQEDTHGRIKPFFEHILLAAAPKEGGSARERDVYHIWKRILKQYSTARLSFEKDRLVAISGVITAIQQASGWKNQAGLWQPFMCRELLWKRNAWEIPQRTGLAPSWSWVSINGGFHYYAERNLQSHPFEYLSVVRACTDEEAKEYGITAGAQVALRVFYKPVPVARAQAAFQSTFCCWVTACGWPTSHDLMCSFDFETTSECCDGISVLPLILTQRLTWAYGLVIRPSSNCAGAFERVGTFEWDFAQRDTEVVRLLTSAIQPGYHPQSLVLV